MVSFHGKRTHFHHLRRLQEAVKFCQFSQILKEPDLSSLLVDSTHATSILFCLSITCTLSEGDLSYHHQTDFTIFSHALKTLRSG